MERVCIEMNWRLIYSWKQLNNQNNLNMSKYDFQEQEEQQDAQGLDRWSPPTKYMYTIFMHKTWNIKGKEIFLKYKK